MYFTCATMEPLPAKFTVDGTIYRNPSASFGRDQIILLSSVFLLGNLLYCLWDYIRVMNKRTGRRVIVLRGMPGSGKTQLFEEYMSNNPEESCWCVSNYDLFYDDDGNFSYDNTRQDESRARCMENFIEAMNKDYDTIFVNNVNSQLWEYESFITLAKMREYNVEVWTLPCDGEGQLAYFQSRNQYGVPLSYARKLFDRWEDDSREELLEVTDCRRRHIRYQMTEAELDEQMAEYWRSQGLISQTH
jgi:hypothetical protein